MSISRVPYERQTVYQDLRRYRLDGTGYRWKFSVSPMGGSRFKIVLMLKKRGLFQPILSKREVVVEDYENDDMMNSIKQSLDAMLDAEGIKDLLGR